MITTAVLFAISLGVALVLHYFVKGPTVLNVPTATPSLPIVGSAPWYRRAPIEFLKSQRRRHGDIVLVNLGVLRVVFFLSPEGTNALLKGTEKSGVSLPATVTYLFGEPFRKALEKSGGYDASHKIIRSYLWNQETIDTWLAVARTTMKGRLQELSDTGEVVALFDECSNLVMTIIMTMFLGVEFAKKHATELIPKIIEYENALQTPQAKLLPRWASAPGRCLAEVERRFKVLVDEEIAFRLKNGNGHLRHRDYLQAMLEVEKGSMTEALLSAGHANQTTTFSWSLLHALRSPLMASLRQTKSKDLLEATFREIGRLYSNIIFIRRVMAAQDILGVHVPAGAYIASSPLITARDPNLFPDPEKFRPERWLTPTNQFDSKALTNTLRAGSSTQFGKGEHMCVGRKVGKLTVLDAMWDTILGNGDDSGFDVELIDGIFDGVGLDNVGVEGAWSTRNLGTPFQIGRQVRVRFKKL